jgi:glycosyltransferase involved in cell wall biosynthesis
VAGPPDRPTILWVTAQAPDRTSGGGSIRQVHLLAALAEQATVDLVLAGRLRDESVRQSVRSVVEVEGPSDGPDAGGAARLRDRAAALTSRQPDEVRYLAGARRALAPLVRRDTTYDLVTLEHAGLAPLVPRRRSSPWAITLHNVGSRWAEQAAATSPGLRGARLRVEGRRSAGLERRIMAAFDLVVVPSDEDAALLRGDAAVVPNGVDVDAFVPGALPPSPSLVFTGTLDYLPNADGLAWFCAEVLPLVRASCPSVTLDIVGSRAGAAARSLASLPGVRLHLDVAAVQPYLAASRVAVVPLRIGTGTRLKALEAMAAGRPVAGTTVGLEGLGLVPGRHAMVADAPAELAQRILALLGDDALARRLAAAGRALVEARFDWRAIGRGYSELLVEASARSAGAGRPAGRRA